jgi:outer membrane protein assembly factor BamB
MMRVAQKCDLMKRQIASLPSFALLIFLVISGFSGAFAVSGENSSVSSNSDAHSWSMFQNNLSHQGYTPSTGPQTNQTLWTYKVSQQTLSAPTVVKGVVYVGSTSGDAIAVNASNGQLLWSYRAGGAIYSSLAIADGVAYFGSWDNYVYAVNASTGQLIWRYQTGSYVQSSPSVAGGIVYIASYDAKVYALDTKTGLLVWSYNTLSGAVGSSPAVVNGVVYIGDNGGKVHALNALNGSKIWVLSLAIADTIYSSPAVTDGVVYIGADQGTNGSLCALSASTGQVLWSYKTPNLWVYSSPAVANGVVYVGSFSPQDNSIGKLFALNAHTGAKLWSYGTGGEIFSSPAIANDIVYISGGDGEITALRVSDGSIVWSCQTETPITWSSPAVVGGILYVGSDNGVLYAFGGSTTVNTPTPIPTSPAPTPTPVNTAQPTTQPTSQPSTEPTINMTLSGNITFSQISNLTIAATPATNKTTISFALTGQDGTVGFCNMTLPKNTIPNTTNPSIYIDNELAQNQGYAQDANNYYIWFTTHFSTHQVSIEFSYQTNTGGVEGSIDLIQILCGVSVSIVIVVVVLVVRSYSFTVTPRTPTTELRSSLICFVKPTTISFVIFVR